VLRIDKMRAVNLTSEARSVIVFLHKEGYSVRKISEKVGKAKTTVYQIIKKFMETGSVADRPRSGRPRISTPRDDKVLIRISKKDRHKTSPELAKEWSESTGTTASTSLVRQRLLSHGLHGCKARRKPLLTEKQRKSRLRWAREHASWTVNDWKKVIVSDESTFNVNNHAGNCFVRRYQYEEYSPQCIVPTIKHPISVMFWGCITSKGVGRLSICSGMMNAQKYIETLNAKLLPTIKNFFSNKVYIFQDDNAPCHRAKAVKEWMKTQSVSTLNWPA